MNTIDIAILVIMGLSCLMGIVRGLTREVLGLLTWAGAGFAAYTTYPLVSHFARGYIANTMIADTLSGVALFIVYLVVFSIIAFNISNAIRGSVVGSVDRGLGLAFGVARGAILICAIEIFFSLFILREAQSHNIQTARFVPMVRRGADELLTVLPANVREILDQQSQKIRKETIGQEPVTSQLLVPVDEQSRLKAQTVPAAPPAPVVESIVKPMAPNPVRRPMTPADSQATVDSLSELRPQAVVTGTRSNGEYDKRQQRELDRLIENYD